MTLYALLLALAIKGAHAMEGCNTSTMEGQ